MLLVVMHAAHKTSSAGLDLFRAFDHEHNTSSGIAKRSEANHRTIHAFMRTGAPDETCLKPNNVASAAATPPVACADFKNVIIL